VKTIFRIREEKIPRHPNSLPAASDFNFHRLIASASRASLSLASASWQVKVYCNTKENLKTELKNIRLPNWLL